MKICLFCEKPGLRPNRAYCNSSCRNAWWADKRRGNGPVARRGRRPRVSPVVIETPAMLRRSERGLTFPVPSHVTATLRGLEAAFISDVLFNPAAFDLSDEFQWGMA